MYSALRGPFEGRQWLEVRGEGFSNVDIEWKVVITLAFLVKGLKGSVIGIVTFTGGRNWKIAKAVRGEKLRKLKMFY